MPGSPHLVDHPRTLNVREDQITPPLNRWIAGVFTPPNRTRTLELLTDSQGTTGVSLRRQDLARRLTQAEAHLQRHLVAIEAGVDPAALVDAMNRAQTERAALRAELDSLKEAPALSITELESMLDSLGDIAITLDRGDASDKKALYEAIGIQMRYVPTENALQVTAEPRVLARVSEGGDVPPLAIGRLRWWVDSAYRARPCTWAGAARWGRVAYQARPPQLCASA